MRDRIERIIAMSGNYSANSVYVSFDNMKAFLAMFSEQSIILEDLLITPFLINTDTRKIYELHYYEFEIHISSLEVAGYREYSKENNLPKEVIKNLKPRVIVSDHGIREFSKALKTYLDAMKKMKFREDIDTYPELKHSELFFQLY